ncbi:hypothetical protein R5W24_002787 [Gemmata sp. JC717]|nr:hypothetical protein [Gemmata algarum]MDY3553682.1 hypothetical protein [Gemmata algarum]
MTDREKGPLAVAAGAILAATGACSRRPGAAGLMIAGAGLVWYGLGRWREAAGAGRRAAHLARYGAGVSTGIYDHVAQAAKEERHPAGTLIEDVVEEASDDSFPCSDPPSWTAR